MIPKGIFWIIIFSETFLRPVIIMIYTAACPAMAFNPKVIIGLQGKSPSPAPDSKIPCARVILAGIL